MTISKAILYKILPFYSDLLGTIVWDLKNPILVVTISQTFNHSSITIEMRALNFFVLKTLIDSMHELQIIANSRPGQLSNLELNMAVF